MLHTPSKNPVNPTTINCVATGLQGHHYNTRTHITNLHDVNIPQSTAIQFTYYVRKFDSLKIMLTIILKTHLTRNNKNFINDNGKIVILPFSY